MIVDVVAGRLQNLHDEFIRLMQLPDDLLFPGGGSLYAVAYQPFHRDGEDGINVWPYRLAFGQPLPTVPLAVRDALILPLPLESTYRLACRSNGL